MSEPRIVSGKSIIEALGDVDLTIEPLPPLKKAGLRIAIGVGGMAFIVIIAFLYQFIVKSPNIPNMPTTVVDNLYNANLREMLANYKIANDTFMDGLIKLFDVVIVKVLYPLFTLILGYIFGTINDKSNNKSNK